MSSSEVDRKQTGALPNGSSPDSPRQAKHRFGRSAAKNAAARHRASRRASRRKRAHFRDAGVDVDHVGIIEPEATRLTASATPTVASATKAPSLSTDSPFQQGPSRDSRSSLGLPDYATAGNVEPRSRSSVSHLDKSPLTESGLPRKTFQPRNSKNCHVTSSDTKGFRAEDYAESSANPTKETPGSETLSPCRECEPLNRKGGRRFPGRSKVAYTNRHVPDSTSPSLSWGCGRNRQFSKQETSLTKQINSENGSNVVEARKAKPPEGRRPPRETPRAPSRRRSVVMDIGRPDETLLSRSKSFLFFWRLGTSEGYSADSPRWQKSRRRLTSSSPATSIDNSHLSRASRTTLFTALLIPCAVVGIIALLLIRAHPKSGHAKHTLWVEQLGNACVTVDCHSAVWELTSSIDLFADPCKDFYSFACGRWANASSAAGGGDAKRHNNYMAIQRRAYVSAVNATLFKTSRLRSSIVYNSIAQHMNVVYRSCLSFVEEEPVDLRETLRASGIHLSLWTDVTTFEDLFAVAVRHALFYNMTTAIDVRWARDPSNDSSAGTLEISPGLSMVQLIGSSSRRSFISRALPVITSYSTSDQIDALESIDDTLAMWSSRCSKTEVTEVSLWELDTPATNWSLIVGEYAKLTGGKEPPSKARVSNLPDVRVILEVLANSSLPDLKVYLMLVPMSQFFGLEDDIQHQKLVSVDDAGGNAVKCETCVRALELLFGDRYRLWVSTHVHRPGTTTDVRRIWEEVLQATRSLIQSLRNIHAEYHNMSAPHTGNGARYPGSTIFSSQQSGEPAALPSQYSDDFLSNVILFSQKSPYGRRSKCEPFLSRESLVMKWTDPETFARLLVPDFYHPEATEVVVNYATVGYFLGELAFRAELPKNWNESQYGSCMARHVRARLGVSPPRKQWRQLIERRWAAQAALRAAATRHAQVYASRVLMRLFFLRLEHTCCALADRDDVSDSGELRTTCDVVAMTVPRFAEAFGCHNLHEMNC